MISSAKPIQVWQKRFIRIALKRNFFWEPWVDQAVNKTVELWAAMEMNLQKQVERKNTHE